MKIYGISLAAGYGKRLLPLTAHIPKPLLPFCGKSIIDLTLERLLFSGGAELCVVNTHHLGSRLEEHLSALPYAGRLRIFPEKEILGTGGPFVHAKSLLREADLILLQNADVVCDFDVSALIAQHVAESNIATMALIDGPENRVLCAGGKVYDILGKLSLSPPEALFSSARLLTYGCVAAFSPEIFDYLPEEPIFCSLIDGILNALKANPGRIGAYLPPRPFEWTDIGSFGQYFEIHRRALEKDPFRFGKDCRIGENVRMSGFVSAGDGCEIGDGAVLSDCILLPGTGIRPGAKHVREVIGPGFSVHRDYREISALDMVSGFLPDLQVASFAEQGSSRRFYRLRKTSAPEESRVLMLSSAEDADFQRFIDIGLFFSEHGLSQTPRIHCFDSARFAVLMEDLGDDTLHSLATRHADKSSRLEDLYRHVIDASADFQIRGNTLVQEHSFPLRRFDYAYLRWESDYFLKFFLEALCGIRLTEADRAALKKEFHTIAAEAESMPHLLMHRDFQSQNILFHQGQVRFVDYQGARIGPYAYDIMSLLKDPYFILEDALRSRLEQYHRQALELLGMRIGLEQYRKDCTVVALQRNMQCLGAYGFLSLVRKKRRYLSYVEPCLRYLRDSLRSAEAFSGEWNLSLLSELAAKAESSFSCMTASSLPEGGGRLPDAGAGNGSPGKRRF